MRSLWLAAGIAVITTGCAEPGAPDLIVDRLELSSPSVVTSPATMVQLTAVPRTASGQQVPGRVITWSGGDQAIATVSSTGLITAIALGATSVTASADGKSATASVNIIPTSPGHLAASWRMDSFDTKALPANYAVFVNEPVGDRIVALVEIRLDSARKTITTGGLYQRSYHFTELHDGVVVFRYSWGDHGTISLGNGVPVPISMVSEFIQDLTTSGEVRADGKLALTEQLWIGETPRATSWSRR